MTAPSHHSYVEIA